MKVSSISVAIMAMSLAVQAQFDETSVDDLVSEAISGPGPCNGFPEYRDLPINRAFYLGLEGDGTHTADSAIASHRIIQKQLQDGVRYLDLNICKHQGQILTCSRDNGAPSTLSFQDILDQIFEFSRDTVEQIIILNLNSENVQEPVDTASLEALIDEKCKIHTELTEGTDEFVSRECPFIYTHVPGRRAWPSMGEVVNFDPDMAQWEGDGVIVGVRTKLLLTKSENILSPERYRSAYFTPKFWNTVPSRSLQKKETVDQLRSTMNQACKKHGGIGLEAHSFISTLNEKEQNPQQQQELIEDLIVGEAGCNLNSSPPNTYFSFVSVAQYDKTLPFLKELQKRMMKLNFAKWNGEPATLEPSAFLGKKKQVQRDEL